jgi:VanZ family protein
MLTTRVGLWSPVAIYMAAIFLLSSTARLPAPPGGLSDKQVHALVYAGLCAVTARAFARGAWRRLSARTLALAWLVTVFYGATDEWHQGFVPGRTTDLMDLAADAAGAAIAALALGACGIIARLRRAHVETR